MKKMAMVALTALAMVGCGGGGSSSSSSGTSEPVGAFVGTTDNGTDVLAVFLPGKVLYVIYADEDGIAGGMMGKVNMLNDGAGFTANVKDYSLADDDIYSLSMTGDYRENQSVNITVVHEDETEAVALDYYQADKLTFDEIAGHYAGDDGYEGVVTVITTAGAVTTEADDGCTTSGQLTEVAQINAVFKISLTYGATCGDYSGETVKGLVAYDKENQMFSGIAHNADFSAGGILWGQQPM